MIDFEDKGEELIVSLILAVRKEFMREAHFKPMTHWDQLQTRVLAAARTTGSPMALLSSFRSGLKLTTSPSLSTSEIAVGLVSFYSSSDYALHSKIESEVSYLFACARLLADAAKKKEG